MSPMSQVSDVRRTLALAAARFYPKQPEKIVAVTGTSGKSSVADFTRQLFAHLGYKSRERRHARRHHARTARPTAR